MKKFVALALAFLMLLPLGACGKKNNDKVLRVAMECAYAPYNWTQNDDSNGAVPIYGTNEYAYGYDIMWAKLIAEKLGYTLEVHKIEWTALPTALETGTVDCVIAGQSITAERKQVVDFTNPYYYASIVVLTKKDSAYANAKGLSELSGAKATSQIGTVWYDECVPQIPNVNKNPAMDDVSAMFVSLDSGVIDLVVTDEPTAKSACFVYPDFKMLDFTGSTDNFNVAQELIDIGISVKKGNDELRENINKILANYTKDDYEKMMDEAVSLQPMSK